MKARKYLAKRKLTEEITHRFQLGFAQNKWDSLLINAKKAGFDEEILLKAGLIRKRKDGRGYYDYFRNRLIFPIFNVSGKVIGFGGRALSDEDMPKYLNTSETRIYHKGKNLYGLYQGKASIIREQKVLIVEGYTDVLSLHQNGIEYAVASLGTSFTEEQASLISRYTKHCVLIYDADVAGFSATSRGIDILIGSGFEIGVVRLPAGKDPDEYVKKYRKDGFERLLLHENNFFDYMLLNADVSTIERKTQSIKRILSSIAKIRDNLRQSLYIRRLSEEFGIDESTLRHYLTQESSNISLSTSKPSVTQLPIHEKQLLGLMLTSSEALEIIAKEIELDDFQSPLCRKLAGFILERYVEGDYNRERLLDRVDDPEVSGLISHLLMTEQMYDDNLDKWLGDKIKFLRTKRIKAELSIINEKLKTVSDDSELAELMRQYKELSSKIKV